MNKSSGKRALFVYYKVEASQHQACSLNVQDFLKRLSASDADLQLELMQRPEPSSQGTETWMEIYRHPDGISDALIAAIQKLATEMDLPAPRASEVFIPLRH
jgi:hypothetical protein